ncbi:MAG: S8 family serine peptidase [Anaerolineales bacterium]
MKLNYLHRVLLAAILCLLPASLAIAQRDERQETPLLRLHRGTFDAAAQPAAAADALAAFVPGPYAIIQLRGPVTVEDRAALESTGVELLEYLPDYAFLVRGDEAQISTAATLPQVYASAPFTLADKLAPSLLRALERGETDLGRVRVIVWEGREAELSADLQTLSLAAEAESTAAQTLSLAGLEAVRWIEPVIQPRLLNDVARGILRVNEAWATRNKFGAGQIVGVADSGLDTGSLGTLSPDFAGRLVATHALVAGQTWDDNFGHGTHVAGSIAGAGVQSGANPSTHSYTNSFAGLAPEARLVIQAFEVDTNGEIAGLPDDYAVLFGQAYADGARLHSDSWGGNTGPVTDTAAAFGGYPYGTQRTDQFVYENPDLTLVVAAGNSGKDGTPIEILPGFPICLDGDGVVDPDSMLAPGTAKNVITVGASESLRSTGGIATSGWSALSFCFLADPIASDLTSNNANGMAAFSSRGPTDDGRVKPDIVAPGTNIISNRSHVPGANTLWGEYDAHYLYSGGTSMATPLTTGLATLAREWLNEKGFANPSAALVKALLLNTTRDIAPGQYGTGATQEIPLAHPNSAAGWGRADAGFMTAPAPYGIWMDDRASGLNTGQSVEYAHSAATPLTVITTTQPLRVMLVWTDPPASLSAAQQLVNDLDLTVTGPDSSVYRGNGVAIGDRTNNVEGVVINSPMLGAYTVRVQAFNVPLAAQRYALVVTGPINGALIPPTGSARVYLPLLLR